MTLPSGQVHTDWIDAKSFLELKYERTVHSATGMQGVVTVALRDYQTFNGLVIPLTIETGGTDAKSQDRMVIEKVALNPVLDATAFTEPGVGGRAHHGVLVNVGAAPAAH